MEPIRVEHLLGPLNEELVVLLRGLSREEWNAPTVAGAWTVKDVAGHLLDTSLRRLSLQRDRHVIPPPGGDIAAFVNGLNAEGVSFARRLSAPILIEMLDVYGRQMASYLESLDPFAPAQWAVSWAGDSESPQWFDTARELTERWHHQQQIRDAVSAAPLYEERYFGPVIETFVRALPHTYREVSAPAGTAIEITIDDAKWYLVRNGRWTLTREATPSETRIQMTGDTAWRLFTKGLREKERVRIDGSYGEPILAALAIVA